MSWNLDLAHSQIAFSVRHMMISKVKGYFERFEGEFNVDEKNPAASTINVRIDTASINTRNAQRDGHLRSPDFFDTENYPTASFVSKEVQVLDSHHARLLGDLTIRDVTHPVALDVEFLGSAKSPWGTTSFGFNASTLINRKDWNLTWNQGLETGGVLVGDEITIEIELELVQVSETTAVAAA